MPRIRDYRMAKGVPSIAESYTTRSPYGGSDVGIDTEVGFPTWDISEPEPKPETDSWQEEFSYAQLEQQGEQFMQNLETANDQFINNMTVQGELYGFEREKWEYLTAFQQEQFDFSKEQWKDQKAQFQEELGFQKEQWKDQKAQFQEELGFQKEQWEEKLAITKEKLKRRPPPVWGI